MNATAVFGFPGFDGCVVKGKGRIVSAPEHVMVQGGNCTIASVVTATGRFALVRKHCGKLGDVVANLPSKVQKAIECSKALPEIGSYDHRQGGFYVKVFMRLPLTEWLWGYHVFVPCNADQGCMPNCKVWH